MAADEPPAKPEPEEPLPDGPLLPETSLTFSVAPPPAQARLDSAYITEIGSRVLISVLGWARGVPMFAALAADVQESLARARWTELFVLGLFECREPLGLTRLLSAVAAHLSSTVHERRTQVARLRMVSTGRRRGGGTPFSSLSAVITFTRQCGGGVFALMCWLAVF